MSMLHGGAWRSILARGKEGAPRRSALPQVSPPTGYVQVFVEVLHRPRDWGTPKDLRDLLAVK